MAFKHHIEKLFSSHLPRALFIKTPTLTFYPNVKTYPQCQKNLKVQKTRVKTISTLHMGTIKAREILLECTHCGQTIGSNELLKLIPYRSKFGYDIIVHIGIAVFLNHRNESQLREELWEKGIKISASEINYLARKFIVYLAVAHKQSNEKLKDCMDMHGGYILHLDGTCDGDSPHLMTGMDGVSKMVLANIKIPSENSKLIAPFLEEIKQTFGEPKALVHDMGKGILSAVEKVFPNIPDFICHFHFLRDIGKDLFSKENDTIRTQLKNHGIQASLRKNLNFLKNKINLNSDNIFQLSNLFNKEKTDITKKTNNDNKLDSKTALYTLIQWVLAGKKHGDGYGFPFDRPHLEFYQRLLTMHDLIQRKTHYENLGEDKRIYCKIARELTGIIRNSKLKIAVSTMQKKIIVFDKLRFAMRITLPSSKLGLRDQGEGEKIQKIESKVQAFYKWLCKHDQNADLNYNKMIRQIEKYWKKLFADPIVVDTPKGQITMQPQRTNNILEQFFRDLKRWHCQKTGYASMNKTLKAMLADTPLVKNLENSKYLNIILNGKTTLEERFAEIDYKIVKEEFSKKSEFSQKIPSAVLKIIKDPSFSQVFTNIFLK